MKYTEIMLIMMGVFNDLDWLFSPRTVGTDIMLLDGMVYISADETLEIFYQ